MTIRLRDLALLLANIPFDSSIKGVLCIPVIVSH